MTDAVLVHKRPGGEQHAAAFQLAQISEMLGADVGRGLARRRRYVRGRHPADVALLAQERLAVHLSVQCVHRVLSSVGSSTILPGTSPDSTSRCASLACDNGSSFSICALSLPAAAAAKHFGMSSSSWPVRPMMVIFLW